MTQEQVLSELVLVTTVYGKNHLPFLAPHLYTVSRCHPEATELVLWQDLPRHEIDVLASVFPHCRFLQIEEPIEGHRDQKTSRKLECWRMACQLYLNNPLCFIDCDTLLVKPIGEFFTSDFDVLFTWKDEPFPLNTGALLVRDGHTGCAFFEEWAARTERIVTDPRALSRALATSGGGDQHALREIIGFANYNGLFKRRVGGQELTFKGLPCRLLNETNCVAITDDTHVIHYKGGWHPIILRGEGFSEHRPEEKCREMYDLWIKTAADANAAVARNVLTHAARKCVDTFRQVIDTHEERGILHSEMLAICAVCDELDVEVIIESGRARGQSTYMLAKYFRSQPVKIISIDWKGSYYFSEEDDTFARERLAPYDNVEILYGDSLQVMPELVRKLAGKRIAVLLDGPKGQVAMDLLRRLISEPEDIVAAFFHDTMKGTPQRQSLEDTFARVFFTDDQGYLKSYSELDVSCIKPEYWHPYWSKNYGEIESYGPTLAIVFPKPDEGLVEKDVAKKGFKITALKRAAELVKGFLSMAIHKGLRSALKQGLRWVYLKSRS